MATRPSSFLGWIPDNTTNIIAPSSGQKNTGWLVGQKPPAQYTNWQINLIDQWLQYFDQVAVAWPSNFCNDELSFSEAISACVTAGGGIICMLQSFSIVGSHTIPENTVFVGRAGESILTIGGSAVLSVAERAVLQDLLIRTSKTSGTLVQTSGMGTVIRDNDFLVEPTNALVCVSVASNANVLETNVFRGTAAPAVAIGIQFELGYSDNVEEDNIFTP